MLLNIVTGDTKHSRKSLNFAGYVTSVQSCMLPGQLHRLDELLVHLTVAMKSRSTCTVFMNGLLKACEPIMKLGHVPTLGDSCVASFRGTTSHTHTLSLSNTYTHTHTQAHRCSSGQPHPKYKANSARVSHIAVWEWDFNRLPSGNGISIVH